MVLWYGDQVKQVIASVWTVTYDPAMMTLFHAFVQLTVLLFTPVMAEGKRGHHAFARHSTYRRDTIPVMAIMAREGYEALNRFARIDHTRHARSAFA